MADSAQAEPQASAGNPEIDTALRGLSEGQAETKSGDAAPAPDIKQEPAGATDPALADFPDLSFALESFVSKRPLEDNHDTTTNNDHSNSDKPNNDEQASKRVKTEQQHEEIEPSFDEDGMELLVANALNDANLMNGFGESSTNQHHEPDAMDLDVPNAAPAIELPRPAPSFDNEPQNCLRIRSLYSLGNLAISTLLILSRNPIDDALITSRFKDTDQGKNFDDLRSAFDAIKRLYGSTDIISLNDPPLDDAEAQSIISLSNLAQLGFWLSEASEASLNKASDNLFAIASEKDISSKMADLCLSIRTQLAVESLAEAGEGPFDVLMNKVFSDDLESNLQSRRGEHDEMPEAEQHLLTSVELRREAFLHELQTTEGRASLGTQYPASHLSRNFATYTRDRLSSATELATKLGLTIPANEPTPVFDGLVDDNIVADIDMDDISSLFERTAAGLVESALAGVNGDEHHDHANMNGDLSATNDANSQADGNASAPRSDGPRGEYEELQALVAQSTSDYVETTLKSLSPATYQLPHSSLDTMATQSSYLNQYPNQQNYNTYQQPPPDQSMQQAAPDGMLPPHQTDSTAALYDKARQAALSKSSAHTRREGLNSTRRPWTQAEEKALMAGLDMVKGPHWSQILTLFGQNGTISNILSERTQVQLKDKARNLKLFFLKTNSEMPFYLQAVTGELKTRAPTQAARKEAEERARMNSEEDQAKVQGIMALSHLQYPHQNMQPPQTPNQQHLQQQQQHHQSPHKGVNSPALQPAHAQPNTAVGQQQAPTQYQTTPSQPPLAPATPQNNYQATQGQQQSTPRPAAQAPQTQSPYAQTAHAPQTTQAHQPQHIQPRQPAPAPQQQQQQQPHQQQAQRPQQSQNTTQTGQTQASPSQHRPMHLPQVPMQRPVQPATATQSPAQPTTSSVTASTTTTTPPVRTSSIQFKTSFPHTTSQSQIAAQASAAAGKSSVTAAASIQPRPYSQTAPGQTGSPYSATAQTAVSRSQQSPPLGQGAQRTGSQTPQSSAQSLPRPQQTNGSTQGTASPAQHPRPVLPQTQQALNASRPQGQNQQAQYASSPVQQRTGLPQNNQGNQQSPSQNGQNTAVSQGHAQNQQQYNTVQARPQSQQPTAQGQAQAQQNQPRPQYQGQQPQGQQTHGQQPANMARTGSGSQSMALPGQQQNQQQAQQQAPRPQSQGSQQQQQQHGQTHHSPHTSQQHTPVQSRPHSTTQSPAPPSRPQSNPQFANQGNSSASPAPSQPPAQNQPPAQTTQQAASAVSAAGPAKAEAPADPLAALGVVDDNDVDADLLRDLQAAIASAAAST